MTDLIAKHIPPKAYLGDGVYVESRGYGIAIWLTTENGVEVTNRISLEEGELRALDRFIVALRIGVKALIAERAKDADNAG